MLLALAILVWPATGSAQNIQTYFPSGVSGYDQGLGVTVLSRLRPLYETPSLRVGGFNVSSNLDDSLSYNSNVNGTPGSGSWGNRTSASVSVDSDWSRNNLDATLGVSHNQWFSFPDESETDWNVGLAGGYTIGDDSLQAAYSHQISHQIGVSIGTVTSETPVLDQTDSAHLGYVVNLSRFTITPDISISAYRYGTATVLGVPLNEQFLDRNVVAAGITTRYSMNDEGGLLAVMRGVTSNFTTPAPGQPSNNSKSIQFLGGLDYQAKGVWRYRLLVGVEVREFQSAQYPTHIGPIAEGSVIWTPTDLTTLTATLLREIEDPQSAGTNGYSLTQANLVLDHEFMRNVFLQAHGRVQYAQYLQTGGGTQTGLGIGGSVSWLLNRRVRLSLGYDFNQITGSSNGINALNQYTSQSSEFTQQQVALTVHFAL
jgi:hypothetical protein